MQGSAETNNRAEQSDEKQYDGRIGERMKGVIKGIESLDRKGEVYKSQWDLAKRLYGPNPSREYGYPLVERLWGGDGLL